MIDIGRLIHVLLVEDSPSDALIVREHLSRVRRARFELTHVSYLREALEALEESSFDAILLDLGLPDSDGLETYLQIKKVAPDLPILLLSGMEDDQLALQMMQKGAEDYMSKSRLSQDTLWRALLFAMERHEYKSRLDLHAQRLAASEAKALSVIQNSLDAILVLSLEGEALFANVAAEFLFLQPFEQMEAAAFAQLVKGERRTELSVERGAGDIRVVEARVVDVVWEDKPSKLAFLRDITERKNAEEQVLRYMEELERSNNELQQFAYVASHDLQEPLRTISLYTELLLERYKATMEPKAQDYMELVLQSTQRMQLLVSDLLRFSRVETRGKDFEITDSGAILQYVFRNLTAAIRESEARMSHDEMPSIWCDPSQFEQLLQNLVNNAIKFRSPRPLAIHIGTEELQDHWLFSVRDNGIGIASEFRERVFVIFQRLHTFQEYSGTGIGLAICKKIVERHGGEIWLESEPDQGSTFLFTIRKTPPVIHTPLAKNFRREHRT